MMEKNEIMRGVQFWAEEIKKAGYIDKIPPFNDILTGKNPITNDDIKPLFTDVMLGGKKVDIYHWGEASARLYLHIKD